MAVNEQVIKKILQDTFPSVVGKETKVFFAHGYGEQRRFNCQCCHINNMNESSVVAHAFGKKHKLVLRELTARPTTISERRAVPALDAANTSPLQTQIDDIKNQAILGLEYVIEVHLGSNFECVYHCVLCEGRFDLTTVTSHLTAYNHRLKYLEKHFPTAFNELSDLESTDNRELKVRLIEKVCEGIEDQFGRLRLLMVDNSEFTKDRMQTTEKTLNAKHIDEYMGCTFIDLIRDSLQKEQNLSDISDFDEDVLRSRRTSLDSISSQSSRSNSVISLSSSSRSPDLMLLQSPASSRRKSASHLSILPPIAQSQPLQQHSSKMEQFKLQMEDAEKELKTEYEGYKDKPLTHFGYTEEWNLFWRRRYKELRANGESIEQHDFKTEWNAEWKQLMERRLRSDIKSKRIELQQQLGIQSPNLSANILLKKRKQKKSKKDKCSNNEKRSSKKVAERRSRSISTSPSPKWRRLRSNKRSNSPRDINQSKRNGSLRMSSSPRRHLRSSCSSPARQRSRSPRKSLSRQRSRTPRRSSSRRRSRSPQRFRRSRRSRSLSHQRNKKKSESPSRKNATRYSHVSLNYRRNNTPPSYEGKKPSPKLLPAEQLKSPRSSMFPWKRSARSSLSPVISTAIVSPTPRAKPILYRRNTTLYSTKTTQENKKLCAPVPPRIRSVHASLLAHSNGNVDDEPLTILSVLSLLTALEDILGSLGPKVIQLMLEAKSMDKAEENTSYQLLDNHENCILFETIKEKLKGLCSAGLVEANKMNAVKKAIKNMATLVHRTNERQKACEKLQEIGVRKPFPRIEHQQEILGRQVTTHPSAAIKNCSLQNKLTLLAAKEEERKVIKTKLSAALMNQGKNDITDKQLDDLVDTYFEEVEKKKSAKPITTNESNSAAKPVTKPTYQNVPIASPVPKSTDQSVPISEPTRIPKISPSPITDAEAICLNDLDLRFLKYRFSDLKDNEKEHYLKHMEKLEALDPVRFKRIHDENRKSKDEEKSASAEEKSRLSGRPNSDKVYSPGDNIISYEEVGTISNFLIDSDSDSDDSGILASSIANTQQQIAKMDKDLNPISSGKQIPVISSVHSPVKIGTMESSQAFTLSGQQTMFGNSSKAPAPCLRPFLPPLPPIQYQQPQQFYQNNIYQAHPQFMQQFPLQQQYQLGYHPVPPPHGVRPPHPGYYQQPPFYRHNY